MSGLDLLAAYLLCFISITLADNAAARILPSVALVYVCIKVWEHVTADVTKRHRASTLPATTSVGA